MESSLNNAFKRDGLHATPRDSSCSEGSERAPSDRELRLIKRLRRIEEQAIDEKNATATVSSLLIEESSDIGSEGKDSPWTTVQATSRRKTLASAFHPEQHHSGLREPVLEAQLSPLGECHEPKPSRNLHSGRESNLSNLNRERKPQIKFPSPSDKIWGDVNEKLQLEIPLKFNRRKFTQSTVSELSSDFLSYLHETFGQKFGVNDKSDIKENDVRRPKRRHFRMEQLRKKKRELTKARKALIYAGQGDSAAMAVIVRSWRKVMKAHNRLRVELAKKQKQRVRRAAELQFKKDPYKYAQRLFKGPGKRATPEFDENTAYEYFAKTYRDDNRAKEYLPLEGMLRPGLPRKAFETRPPTARQLGRSARRKRNGATPGLDAISYVPFKKCPALILFLHLLVIKIWEACEIADDWAQALISLLKKGSPEEDLDVVSEFRPITIAATMGKIVLSVVSDRLQRFLVKNSFIPRQVQKGFLSGVPGCIEHTFMLFEALKEAKREKRQIVIAWIDLANAFGSVRHNLIQFALDWYHVPKAVQKMIFNYYEKLMAKVISKEWSTPFFLFDIGLFQGCVLSTILFLCVFQMLLDFLQPLREKHGYHFKQVNMKAIAEAYADDLALEARNTKGCQVLCTATQKWLEWTETMRAKPQKSVTFAMKQFDRRIRSEAFRPIHEGLSYSPFDPELIIAGEPMKYILNSVAKMGSEATLSFKDKHFKFLGRYIHYYLQETEIKGEILSKFVKDVETANNSPVNGLMKLWLYQFYILSRSSWSLLIHDLDLSFAKKLQSHVQPLLKKWAGLARTVDPGVLYRTRGNLGLQLTSVEDHYKAMQLVKVQLLENSRDASVRMMWAAKAQREASVSHFRVSHLLKEAKAQVNLDLLFPTQSSRQGLGNGNFKADPTPAEKRKLISVKAKSFAEQARVQHAHSLAQQGVWTAWGGNIVPFDFSWQNLIWGPGPYVIKFVLNASVNWVKTPDLLKTWGLRYDAGCVLCGKSQATLHHIISNCRHARVQGRYTWRHDSVLLYLQPIIQSLIDTANANPERFVIPPIKSNFVRSGKSKSKPKSQRATTLVGASDWKLIVDFDSKAVFPPQIYCTLQRPDIVIWSDQARKVLLVELTCPAEEGIEAAEIRKVSRYFGLKNACKDRGWSTEILTIEAGARGHVAKSIPRLLKRLGRSSKDINSDCKNISNIVSKCTHTIYLSREVYEWDKNRSLLSLEKPQRQFSSRVHSQ